MCLLENLLQLFQLIAGEGGAVSSLLAFVALRLTLVHRTAKLRDRPFCLTFDPGLFNIDVTTINTCGISRLRHLCVCQSSAIFTWEKKYFISLIVDLVFGCMHKIKEEEGLCCPVS